jgi:lysophospholipase L1-like esterase
MRIASAIRFAAALSSLLPLVLSTPGHSQAPNAVTIDWEVRSRFRLFKNEDDFLRLANAHLAARSVFAAETAMEKDAQYGGKGWARLVLPHLCTNEQGQLLESCQRNYSSADTDGHTSDAESYLTPSDHTVRLKANGAADGAQCTWKFAVAGNQLRAPVTSACSKEVFQRVPYGKTTDVQLFVGPVAQNSSPAATASIKVRDVLIAGLGDSTASGEGNPDQVIALDDAGFCFRRVRLPEQYEYFRPSRAGYGRNLSCPDAQVGEGEESQAEADAVEWAKHRALWMARDCHRSLYSYQLRLALALAIENPQIAVTYIPLGCTGATIAAGLLGAQDERESDCAPGYYSPRCSHPVTAQLDALKAALNEAHRKDRTRNLDLVLLTVGANDIGFSELVAGVIVDPTTKEYSTLRAAGQISSVGDATTKLNGLAADFKKLRAALRGAVGSKLEKVIYVSYGDPALYNNNQPCPTSRQGFDVHPAFKVNGPLLKQTSDFVTGRFFPRLKALATCDGAGICQSAADDHMTFVDQHQKLFENHGFCAVADDSDPPFDRCFRQDGSSFRPGIVGEATTRPLACVPSVTSFPAYAPRQRWVRTANDSYFTAMTYPENFSKAIEPENIHDALWGVGSAVYGGAIHPTAQGYAAMADAALPAARQLLGLPAPH